MAKVTAGPFPGNAGYDAFRVKRNESRENKNNYWRDSGRSSRDSSYGPEYKTLTSSLGETYKVPVRDFVDLQSYLHQVQNGGNMQVPNSGMSAKYKNGKNFFGKPKKYLKNVTTPEDYIDYGFSDAQRDEFEAVGIDEELRGGKGDKGHIEYIAYNPGMKLMKVQFAKTGNYSNTVVFFNLPSNIAVTLMHLLKNDVLAPPGPKGEVRHAVGVEFWNLVRVRGTVHSTRFQWIYDYEGGSPASKRGFSYVSVNNVAQTTQVPAKSNPNVPTIAKNSTEAVEKYSAEDVAEIFSNKGQYHDWFKDYKMGLSFKGENYMYKLASDLENKVNSIRGTWDEHENYSRYISKSDSFEKELPGIKSKMRELALLGMEFPEPSNSSYGDKALEGAS